MNPVAVNASAAAILDGYRRAMSEHTPLVREPGPLTQIVESATEHAQGLPPRLPGTGQRLDRTA